MLSDSMQSHLAELWTKVQPGVRAYIFSAVRHHHDTEEVLQNVAQVVADKFEQYDHERPFIAWCLGIARIQVLRYRRSTGRDRLMISTDALDNLAQAVAENDAEIQEMHKALAGCIQQLPTRGRQILDARLLDRQSHQQIGTRLHMSATAVGTAYQRLVARLRECLSKKMDRLR